MTDLVPAGPGTDLAVLSGGGIVLSQHAALTSVGLQIADGASEEELLELAGGLGVVTDAACFAVGDIANFYRDKHPAQYRDWIDRPSPIKGLASSTVKEYAAVASSFPHEQRSRHMASYAGHPGVSFTHFREVRKLGSELSEYWLGRAAEAGWSVQDMAKRLNTAVPGADDVPGVPEAPISEYGQAYWLGPPEDPMRHLVLCGDATVPEHLALGKASMGVAASMMWTDPPYGVSYESVGAYKKSPEDRLAAGVRPIENDKLDAQGLHDFLHAAWNAARGALEEGSPVYVASPSGDLGAAFVASFFAAHWPYIAGLVWRKQRITFGRSDYHYQHETIHYGQTPGPKIGRMPNRVKWYGPDNCSSIFDADVSMDNAEHPTQKPVDLIIPALLNSSRPGEVVLDPFAGSGSTLIAAETTGRRAFCIERDPGYVDTIRLRYDGFLVKRAQGLVIEAQAVEVETAPTSMPEE